MGCQQSKLEGASDTMSSLSDDNIRKSSPSKMRGGSNKNLCITTNNSDRTANTQTSDVDDEDDDNVSNLSECEKRLVPSDILNSRITESGSATYRRSSTCNKALSIEFAACTQSGYYPRDPTKANQDSFSVKVIAENSDNDSSCFFAVYDGHGPKGEIFAQYAKEKLPNIMFQHVQEQRKKIYEEKNDFITNVLTFNSSAYPLLNEKEFEIASTNAHLECNRRMIEDHKKDVIYSGTTATSISIHNGKLIVSNVGDSRAILGCRNSRHSARDNPITAVPLSRDHTAWRKDERERIKAAGGRILSIGQMEGIIPINRVESGLGDKSPGEDDFLDELGDPPRVWCKDIGVPGTSFTRSLGDSIGEQIGVIAQPEFYSKDITDDDKLVVIASDGVFEFLTNQDVIDICMNSSSPADACEQIVSRSYQEWLANEDRADDITAIVISLGK